MKHLNDQISSSQSFVHAQKIACDQFGSATNQRPCGGIVATSANLCNLFASVSFMIVKWSLHIHIVCVTGVLGVTQQLANIPVRLKLCFNHDFWK